MAVEPKLVDLRPDRNLLNPDFGGYKLSLSQVSTLIDKFKSSVDRIVPDQKQYSLLHAKLFLLQNHLIGEDITPESVYFIDKSWSIQKYTFDQSIEIETLWQIPSDDERPPGSYNVSMHLTNEKTAIVSNGMGKLYVLDRGSRRDSDQWSVLFHEEVAGCNFIIVDSIQIGNHFHILLKNIQENEENEKFLTVLHWITIGKINSEFFQTSMRQLQVNGYVQYANFERNGSAIYVISDSGCKFTLDSEKEIKQTKNESNDPEAIRTYEWSQTKDDLTIKFHLPTETVKKNLIVKTKSLEIEVSDTNTPLLNGSLYQRIDPDLTSWTFELNTLEITLQKIELGSMWPEIVPGNQAGDYKPSAGLVEEAAPAQHLESLTSENKANPVMGATFNSQEIEECDFECEKLTIFERISLETHLITHKINLGSNEVLLTVNLNEGGALAFGTKSDVDTCIWQPGLSETGFEITHRSTLLSLAYIKASKQQMKFFCCSPDASYSAICDNKHLFIYCQNKPIDGNELRNRTSGRRINTLAQQQVFSLPPNEEILGIHASNTSIYLLAENYIIALKL